MSKSYMNLWKFTVVHRISLVETNNIIVFGENLLNAKKHVYDLFPKCFFEIKDGHIINNRHFVGILSFQFPDDLL